MLTITASPVRYRSRHIHSALRSAAFYRQAMARTSDDGLYRSMLSKRVREYIAAARLARLAMIHSSN